MTTAVMSTQGAYVEMTSAPGNKLEKIKSVNIMFTRAFIIEINV